MQPNRRQVSQALNRAAVQRPRRGKNYGVVSYGMTFKAANKLFRLVKIARVLTEFGVPDAIGLAVRAEGREKQMVNGVLWAITQGEVDEDSSHTAGTAAG